MSYCFSKELTCTPDEAIAKVTKELSVEGFGILTEIDVKATLKKKIDVDFPVYKILGACNPEYAHKALQEEKNIGTMLPCNVIVRETKRKTVVVAAVDPIASMMAIENAELGPIATEIQGRLKQVIERL